REAAASGRQEALEGWHAWLAAAGLPEGLSPEAARQVLNAVAPARRAADQRRREEERAAAISAAEAAFEARLEALLQRLGRELPATPALRSAALIALADELERSTSARRRGEELQRARQERAERRDALAERAEAADEALRGYLAEHGCADVDELRALAALAGERRELQQQLRETRAALVAIAGGDPHLPALLGEARDADPATLTAARDEAAAEVRRLEAAEAEALTREGALRAEVRRLEAAEELGARRQELAVAEAQAAEEARAWAVRAVALALLAETRHRYERERQPQVVRDAERYFATITDGRYPGIIAPPGEAQVLVEREQGAPLTSEQLSRGTAEQLYLALRFGLIEQFARNAEPLPVVMDDILVNFDPQRAERAARSIVQLAARHQVIFFTCHPRIAELLDPDAVVTQRLS
ncbi:MAG TPA: hypothetical protein VFK93_05020, partial [Candidatus Limnocylindria bacterium]|nr:hypothetical protein [Candidatus Limnocylindria bacterium]